MPMMGSSRRLDAHSACLDHKVVVLRGDILGRAFTHQTTERQRNARHDIAVAHQHVATLANSLDGSHHIGGVAPTTTDVV